MDDGDTTEGIDEIGRRAADALVASLQRRVDVDEALRRLHAGGATELRVVAATDQRQTLHRRLVQGCAVAAALCALVIGGVVLSRRDTPSVVEPANTVAATSATLSTTAAPLASASTAPAFTTAETVLSTLPSTPAATTVPPTAVTLDSSIDALATWPEPPTSTPSLADVPMLLPPTTVPGASSPGLRTEGADGLVTAGSYEQFWFSDVPDVRVLSIQTSLDRGAPSDGEAIELAPWDRAIFLDMSSGYVAVALQDFSGSVIIWSHGLTRDEVLGIAASLHQNDDGPGWQVSTLPTGLQPVHEGWNLGVASRSVKWSMDDPSSAEPARAELLIAHGLPSLFTSAWFDSTTTQIIDVGGAPGVSFELGDRAAVVWSPSPQVTVRLGLYGSIDEAIAIARSLAPVDETTWRSATTPDPSTDDGCNSMFC
jgi:hypothetical protein